MFYTYNIPLIVVLSCANMAGAKQFLWEDMFDNLFMEDFRHNLEYKVGAAPKSSVTEGDKATTIQIAVPGLAKEDIKIDIEHPESNDPIVTVSAHVEQEEMKSDEETKSRSRSVSQQSFSMRFRLNHPVIVEEVKAELDKGMLTILLPRAMPLKKHSHQIQIQ